MSLRDDLMNSMEHLSESLARTDDRSLERYALHVSECSRAMGGLASMLGGVSSEASKKMFSKGNVLLHKPSGLKRIVVDDILVDRYDEYSYVCNKPHAEGDYSYRCENIVCKCHRKK